MEGCIVKAIYDFPKETDADLALNVGDIIKVTKDINDEWCVGAIGNKNGQFPTAFVKIVLKDAPAQVYLGIADFLSDEDGDIRIKKGDIIGLKEEVDAHWVIGKSDASEGLCPKSFLEEIVFKEVEAGLSKEDFKEDQFQAVSYGESIDAFNAQSNEELTFPKGVRIDLVREIDSFWTEGIFQGKQGKFPSLFVKVIAPLPLELQFKENDSQEIQESSNEATPIAKALYFYVGANTDELSFDKGETIALVERVNQEWYKGKIGKSVGLFPANHVEVIVDLPYDSCEDVHMEVQKKGEGRDNSLIINNNEKSKEVKRGKEITTEKPLLKPKPQIKLKAHDNVSKTKPLLLKSSKQNQRNQTPKQKSEGSDSKIVQNHFDEKKPRVASKEDSKIVDEPTTTIRAKDSGKPNRPPVLNLRKDQIISEKGTKVNKNDNEDRKIKMNVAERPPRPKSIKHTNRQPVLENDMPLLSSNRNMKRIETKSKHTTQTISPNVRLLETELSSINLSNEGPSNSTFYVSNENHVSSDESTEEKRKKKPTIVKRPAPKRPESHAFNDNVFIEAKPHNGESISPKLTPKETLQRQSPSSSPHSSRRKGTEKQQSTSKAKQIPPSLPKPLAPQPPEKPLVPPKNQKLYQNSIGDKALQPSFNVFYTSEGTMINGRSKSPSGKQENKADEVRSSLFYVDFFTDDSADGKDNDTNNQEIETVEQQISLIKGQIESESNMLSGIENLLKFSEDEDKRRELMSRQRTLSSSLMDLNEELFAYQDEKSYLLASCGDLNAINSRIEDLSKQIESYKENSGKLRRLKDIARPDEVAEIKDGIEFCDQMVETLLEEIASLKKKIEKEEVKQDEDPVEMRRKLLKQRHNVIKELIQTEKDYHRDIELCSKKILPQLKQSKAIDCDVLFGNLTEICSLSSKLLDALGKLNMDDEENEGIGEKIGQCFVQLCRELETEYSNYCRNYDESNSLLEKLEQDVERRDEIFNVVTTLRDDTGLWDLSSYLIKPVQRILKYPLILQEIHKFSPEDDPDRDRVQQAIGIVRNVATAINEFKRRKDIVQKYQKTEGIGNKIQRLNWHSVRKKSSRINQKITQFTGLVSQTVDGTFIEEEKRFRSVEKLIKYLNRNIALYLELFQDTTNLQKIVAEDIKLLSADAFIQGEIDAFYNVIIKFKDTIGPKFVTAIKSRVFDPLDRLLQLFQSPMKLIEKRQDKCLDYDRLMNRAQKNKDAEKSRQFNDELNMAKNNYEALNSQLLEELPLLTAKCICLLKSCLSNFVEAKKLYLSELTEEIKLTLQFHLIERHSNAEVLQKHAESLFAAAEKISHLIFYPEKFVYYDGPGKPDSTTFSRETFSSFYADTLFDQSDSDPTSPIKPSTPDLSDSQKDHQNETRPVPLPRRRSIRKSSSSTPSSPAKSPGLYLDAKFLELKRERRFSSEETSPTLGQNDELYVVDYAFEKEDAAEISVEEGAVVRVIRKHDKEANPEWWLVQTAHGRGYVPSSYLRPGGNFVATIGNEAKTIDVDTKCDMTVDVSERSQLKPVDDTCVENGTVKHMNNNGRSVGVNDLNPELYIPNNLGSGPDVNGSDVNGSDAKGPDVTGSDVNVSHNGNLVYRVLYDFEAAEEEETSVEEGQIVSVLKVGDDSGNDEWCYVESKGRQGYVPFNYLEPVNRM